MKIKGVLKPKDMLFVIAYITVLCFKIFACSLFSKDLNEKWNFLMFIYHNKGNTTQPLPYNTTIPLKGFVVFIF